MARIVIRKRCRCRDGNGRWLGRRCPRLVDPAHGSWSLDGPTGNDVDRARRDGQPAQASAGDADDKCLASSSGDPARAVGSWTVARWLRFWLSTRTQLRRASRLEYDRVVERVLIPHLGHLRLCDLDVPLLRSAFTRIANTSPSGQPRSTSAVQHVRAVLRAALDLAVRDGMIGTNPARHVEIDRDRRCGPATGSTTCSTPHNAAPPRRGPSGTPPTLSRRRDRPGRG